MIRRLAFVVLPLTLAGCGLHPLYSGGTAGPAGTMLATIDVGPIDGQAGWLLRHALIDRFGAAGHSATRYRLTVELDDRIIGLGINDQNTVTRERRTVRARYRLLDTANADQVVLDATAGSDSGIDVTSSDYSTLAAEQTALENLSADIADQIVVRVASYARRTAVR
jgi:LPS-assembly lipoprotein